AREFGFTTFTNTAVRGIAAEENLLIITTDEGVFQVETNADNNLADFGIWNKLGFAEGLPEVHTGTKISLIDQIIYLGIDNELYRRNSGRYEFVHQEPGFDFQFAVKGSEGILTGWL